MLACFFIVAGGPPDLGTAVMPIAACAVFVGVSLLLLVILDFWRVDHSHGLSITMGTMSVVLVCFGFAQWHATTEFELEKWESRGFSVNVSLMAFVAVAVALTSCVFCICLIWK